MLFSIEAKQITKNAWIKTKSIYYLWFSWAKVQEQHGFTGSVLRILNKGIIRVSAGLCSWGQFLAGCPSELLETTHAMWHLQPSPIFRVGTDNQVPLMLWITPVSSIVSCLPLFCTFKGPYGYTGQTQIIQGTLAKICDLSICRVPLTHNITYPQVPGIRAWASLQG